MIIVVFARTYLARCMQQSNKDEEANSLGWSVFASPAPEAQHMRIFVESESTSESDNPCMLLSGCRGFLLRERVLHSCSLFMLTGFRTPVIGTEKLGSTCGGIAMLSVS